MNIKYAEKRRYIESYDILKLLCESRMTFDFIGDTIYVFSPYREYTIKVDPFLRLITAVGKSNVYFRTRVKVEANSVDQFWDKFQDQIQMDLAEGEKQNQALIDFFLESKIPPTEDTRIFASIYARGNHDTDESNPPIIQKTSVSDYEGAISFFRSFKDIINEERFEGVQTMIELKTSDYIIGVAHNQVQNVKDFLESF